MGRLCRIYQISSIVKGQMNQNFDIFYFSSILVKCVQDEPNKHTSSIEASVFEIFAIKNCYFFALIFVERVGKIVGKNSLWRQCWSQVEKSGKFKTVFFESVWHRNCGVLCGHKLHQPQSKVSTFKFLADPKIREEWLKNLKRESFQPTKHSLLRENHFTGESFDKSYAIKLSLDLKPGKPQLTAANALPPSVHWYTVSTNTPILRF